MRSLFLTADIGSSSLKGGLLDAAGGLAAFERMEFDWGRDPRQTWTAAGWKAAFKSMIRRFAPVLSGARLAGISLSGNGPTLVALDRAGAPIGPVLRWNDAEAVRIPGRKSFYLPKAAWFKAAHPRDFERTARFMACPDYLSFLLTGNPASASPSPDFTEYIWDEAGCRAFGLEPELFAPIVEPGAPLGGVSGTGAELFGLPAGTPVYAAGSDFLMALIGTATVRPGTTCDRAGTSEGINHCTAGSAGGPEEGLRRLPHAIAGLWNVAGILSCTGFIFEWYRRITGQQDSDYKSILGMIKAAEEEHALDRETLPRFFPSFNAGSRWEFERGMFSGLGARHGRGELGLAVVESIAFSVREAVGLLRSAGFPVDELRASGGQAKNPVWNRLKADMLGTAIRVPAVADAELVGCLCCAIKGAGLAASLTEAAEMTVRFAEEYQPDPGRRMRYDEWYGRYKQAEELYRSRLTEE